MNTPPPSSGPPPNRLTAWWWDLSLPAKALLVLIVPLVIIGASIAFGVALTVDQGRLRSDTSDLRALQDDVADLGDQLVKTWSDVLVVVVTGNDDVLTAVDEFAAGYPSRIQSLRDRAGDDQDPVIDALDAAALSLYGEYSQIRGRLLDSPTSGAAQAEVVAWVDAHRASIDELRALADVADESFTAGIERIEDRIDDRGRLIVLARILGAVVAIAASILGLLMFTRSIVKRLRIVGDAAHRVIDGGELGELEPPANDEIGTLISELQRAAAMLIDINAEVTASRDAAVAATREKDEFLSRMSHELRTPLSAILGFGQLLQMEELSDDDRDSVDHIVKAGRHLLALINDLLDISRIATGHLALSLEPVDVAETVDDVIALLRPQAQERDITVTSRVEPGVMVTADRQRLKQVLLNFLSNAIKYNSAAGTVQFVTERWDDEVRVSVTDSGAGISGSARQRLFTPFERLGATSAIEGTGVGLALSKSLVEAMGGSIGVDSVVGRGSTFWVRFRRHGDGGDDAEREAAVEAPATRVPRVAREDGDTVLYVEDNLANVRVMERFMRDRPENLEIVMQGGLALEITRELQPMVVLLDLHLPDMNGGDVLSALKDDPLTSGVPVVIVSADATEGTARRVLDLGAEAYLTKPIDIVELTALLDRIRSERSVH